MKYYINTFFNKEKLYNSCVYIIIVKYYINKKMYKNSNKLTRKIKVFCTGVMDEVDWNWSNG